MELSQEDMMQFLNELQMPKDIMEHCEEMMKQEKYQEIYSCLRCVRCEYLDELHKSQKRLDQLDYIIYQVKTKRKQQGKR